MSAPKTEIIKVNNQPYKDSSTIYKSMVPDAIDKVIKELNSDGYPLSNILVQSERVPIVGNNFSLSGMSTKRSKLFFDLLFFKL